MAMACVQQCIAWAQFTEWQQGKITLFTCWGLGWITTADKLFSWVSMSTNKTFQYELFVYCALHSPGKMHPLPKALPDSSRLWFKMRLIFPWNCCFSSLSTLFPYSTLQQIQEMWTVSEATLKGKAVGWRKNHGSMMRTTGWCIPGVSENNLHNAVKMVRLKELHSYIQCCLDGNISNHGIV